MKNRSSERSPLGPSIRPCFKLIAAILPDSPDLFPCFHYAASINHWLLACGPTRKTWVFARSLRKKRCSIRLCLSYSISSNKEYMRYFPYNNQHFHRPAALCPPCGGQKYKKQKLLSMFPIELATGRAAKKSTLAPIYLLVSFNYIYRTLQTKFHTKDVYK